MAPIQNVLADHGVHVSHETAAQFETYHALLVKWQKAVNLVSLNTVPDAAVRHFLDAAQLIKYIPDVSVPIADLGSGAGFPGMVLAILGAENMHLIESDQKKAAFLRAVSRETKTTVTVHDQRIEDCVLPDTALVTARAFAPLDKILGYMVESFPHARGLFLKGEKAQEEILVAQKNFEFSVQTHPSISHAGAFIVEVADVVRL
ncbi:MAG: 16S rRNA (guanine(527)-N(7))-methyltransferase RsmG [Alphaproteobacteria bacterium]|nr:16S rRNA (guanine(527)-N(7))-methyltransferase RsmG [Alphaproteobacteria bacterium]